MMKLFAGAGKSTIHFPEALFPIEGFMGVHDAPAARVLVMECGEKAALVSLELVMLPPELVDMVKCIVADHIAVKKENIWVHTTHAITTPHAPHAPMGMGGIALEISEDVKKNLEAKLELYTNVVMSAVTEATKEAGASFCPAVLGTGQAESHISINRDMETPFGWWIGINPEGITDPTVSLLRFDDENGKAIALVMNSGFKPCAIDNSQMQENKRLVSSDVPGLACRLIEQEMGAPCLFVMGAAGDQVPKEQALLDEVLDDGTVRTCDLGVEEGLKIVDRLGCQMAADVLPAAKGIRCNEESPIITLRETSVTWAGKGRIPMIPRKTVQFVPEHDVEIGGSVLVIGDIALVSLKPEVNAITAQELSSRSPYKRTLLFSMVNGGQKYMPDAASYEKITWEAQNSMMMPGAAEHWVETVSDLLKDMKREREAL